MRRKSPACIPRQRSRTPSIYGRVAATWRAPAVPQPVPVQGCQTRSRLDRITGRINSARCGGSGEYPASVARAHDANVARPGFLPGRLCSCVPDQRATAPRETGCAATSISERGQHRTGRLLPVPASKRLGGRDPGRPPDSNPGAGGKPQAPMTSKMASTSTAAPVGRAANPSALRA